VSSGTIRPPAGKAIADAATGGSTATRTATWQLSAMCSCAWRQPDCRLLVDRGVEGLADDERGDIDGCRNTEISLKWVRRSPLPRWARSTDTVSRPIGAR
jgi:hypothetical protein